MVNRLISAVLAVACILLAAALFRKHAVPLAPPQASDSARWMLEPSRHQDQSLLETRIATLHLDHVSLEDALFSLASLARVNISAEWRMLEEDGILRTAQVGVHLHDVTLAQALEQLLKSVAQQKSAPQYFVEDGLVVVSTARGASLHTVTEFINIQPLVREVMAAHLSLHGSADPSASWRDQEGGTITGALTMIVTMITTAIDPDSWRDAGGIAGGVRAIEGVLVITQTPENNKAIHRLLDGLYASLSSKNVSAVAPRAPQSRAMSSGARGVASTQPATEFFNIRPLVPLLQRDKGWRQTTYNDRGPITPAEVIEGITKLLLESIDPNSWRETGGTVGKISEVGGILAITQTPDNLEAARRALEALGREATAPGFPSAPSTLPATKAAEDSTIRSTAADTQRVTEFINIRPLVRELQLSRDWKKSQRIEQEAQTPAEIINDILKLITETIDIDTWRDAAGTIGSLREVGGILAISHSPATVREVRNLLNRLHQSASRNEFAPTTRPVPSSSPSLPRGP